MAQHVTECEFRLVSCAHSGCEAVMSHSLLAAHLGRCSYQQFTCPNAKCNVMVSTVLLEQHRAECPKQKVRCKSEGCELIMLREEVPMHLAGRQHQTLVREHAARGAASCNVRTGQIDVATALNQILAQSCSPQRSPLTSAECSCTARSRFVGGLNALPPRCTCPASGAPHQNQPLKLRLRDYNRPAEGKGSAGFCGDQGLAVRRNPAPTSDKLLLDLCIKNNCHTIGAELDTSKAKLANRICKARLSTRIAAHQGCLSETVMTTKIANLQISDRAFGEHGTAQEEHLVQQSARKSAQDTAAREQSVTTADQLPNTLPRAEWSVQTEFSRDECTKAADERKQAQAARPFAWQSPQAEASTAEGNSFTHELQHELCTILEIEEESRLTIEQCERARRQVLLEYEHAKCNDTAAAAAASWGSQSRSGRPVGSMGQAVFAQQRRSNLQCQPASCEDSETPNYNHPAHHHQSVEQMAPAPDVVHAGSLYGDKSSSFATTRRMSLLDSDERTALQPSVREPTKEAIAVLQGDPCLDFKHSKVKKDSVGGRRQSVVEMCVDGDAADHKAMQVRAEVIGMLDTQLCLVLQTEAATARTAEAFGHPQPQWTAGCSVSSQQSEQANAADGRRRAESLAAYHAAYSPDEQQVHNKRVTFLAFSHASEVERPSHCSANRPSLHCDIMRPTQSAGHSGTDTTAPRPLQPLDTVYATSESAEKQRKLCKPVSIAIGHPKHWFGRWHSSIDSPNSPLVPLIEMLDSPPEEFVNITGKYKALKGYSPMSLEPSRVDQLELEAQYTL